MSEILSEMYFDVLVYRFQCQILSTSVATTFVYGKYGPLQSVFRVMLLGFITSIEVGRDERLQQS